MMALNSELYMQVVSQYFNPSKTHSTECKHVKKRSPLQIYFIYTGKKEI